MPPLNVRDLGDFIRDQRKAAQISLRQLARQAGVSNPYLSQIERGLRKPSAEILQQIAKALRISAEVLYIQAGILDERSTDTEVVTAVLADATLTERQKQVIVEIYDAFRKENAAYGLISEAATVLGPATEGKGPDRPATDDADTVTETHIVTEADTVTADGAVDTTTISTTSSTTSSTNGVRAVKATTTRKTARSAAEPRPRASGTAPRRTAAARRPQSAPTIPGGNGNAAENAAPVPSNGSPLPTTDAGKAGTIHPDTDH